MAKATLPVNFQDDIMNTSMGGKRRYRLINNTDGTVSLEDVTEYDQVGSNFGAGQINQTNAAVNAAADASKIIDSLATVNAVTEEGYIAGALALKEQNEKLGGVEFIFDDTGKIIGYKSPGGADTVFPFSSLPNTSTILSYTPEAGAYSGNFILTGFIPRGYKKVFVDISNYGTVHNEQGVNTCVVGGKTLGYGTHTIDDSFVELEDGGYKITYTPVYCNQGGGMLTLKIDAIL